MKDNIIQVLLITLEKTKKDIDLTIKLSDDKTSIHHLPKTLKEINQVTASVYQELKNS